MNNFAQELWVSTSDNWLNFFLLEKAKNVNSDQKEDYTFHSFRKSSATTAEDNGASAQQLISFYGWKSVFMSQEYISTSNCAVMNMASLFSNPAASTVENSINVKIVSSENCRESCWYWTGDISWI